MRVDRTLRHKEHIKLANQSLVFEAFGETEKLTMSEVTLRVNESIKSPNTLSEQTVRRAINDLVGLGHIKPFGKRHNAMTYGKLSAEMTAGNGEEALIPSSAGFESIEDFLRKMADPEGQPFALKVPVLSEKVSHAIRRTMVHVVLSASEPGNSDQLKKANVRLNNVIAELEFIAENLKAFVDSPIWYEQYRDRMGYGMRRLQEKDPELFQLAMDYKNGG